MHKQKLALDSHRDVRNSAPIRSKNFIPMPHKFYTSPPHLLQQKRIELNKKNNTTTSQFCYFNHFEPLHNNKTLTNTKRVLTETSCSSYFQFCLLKALNIGQRSDNPVSFPKRLKKKNNNNKKLSEDTVKQTNTPRVEAAAHTNK